MDYFRRNNYEKVRDLVFRGVVIGFVVSVTSTAVGNTYLNGQAGQANYPYNDNCNKKDNPEAAAYDFSNAAYFFCLSIKEAKKTLNVPTHFTAGTIRGDASYIDGTVNLNQFIVSSNFDEFAEECTSLGVTWKRAAIGNNSRGFVGLI
ncbi:hypothetical protein C8A05DRAFT_36266 [Staphylotrichum tortipilum]|uniref:Uncharacterized protein n=1 Tax=Staphylotrichum tortipilum TaxID=2831512 RepID=A0AAN6MFU1_9PEZI|nr:hypothetical protein C8A05DRAFT_36266 [Staphylotrichum longicolle]